MTVGFDAPAQQELRKIVRLTPDLGSIQSESIPRLAPIECKEVGLCKQVDDQRTWLGDILTAMVNFRCFTRRAVVEGDDRDSQQQEHGLSSGPPYPVCSVCLGHIASENRTSDSQWAARRLEPPYWVKGTPGAEDHESSAGFKYDSSSSKAERPLLKQKSTKARLRAAASQKRPKERASKSEARPQRKLKPKVSMRGEEGGAVEENGNSKE